VWGAIGVLGAVVCLALIPLTETFTVVTGFCLALVVLLVFAGAGTWTGLASAPASGTPRPRSTACARCCVCWSSSRW
jgi:hypothetical protein